MMEIIKTTDYFNKSIEELSELRNDGTYSEAAQSYVMDNGGLAEFDYIL